MDAVFRTVLNMSITGGLIIAALALIRLIFKGLPRRYSYILWAIPAFRLLCPISVSSAVSFFNLLKPKAVEQNRMEYFTPPATEYVAPTLPANPVTPTLPPMYHDTMEDVVEEVHKSLSLGEIAGIIWAVVAVGILLWAVISYISIGRKVRFSEKADGCYICPNIPSPFVFGIFRPKIFLPTGISPEDTECILEHERTHIKRRDYLVKLLTVPVLALHWFNPLVWLGIRLMTSDMELSCDERALRGCSDSYKKIYANALLNISMKQNGISLNGVLGFGETDIKGRIKGVLRMKKPKLWATVAAISVVAVAAVCLLTNAVAKNSGSSALPDEFDGYISYEKADIPTLASPEAADGKVLFAKAEVGDVTAYLLGEGVYRDGEDSASVFARQLMVGISTDGRTISSTYPAPAEFEEVSQSSYRIYTDDDASDYLSAFDMELPIIELRYIGEDSDLGAFYAVRDGELWQLTGDTGDIGGEASGVCFTYAALEKGSEPDTLVSDGENGVVYTFNFDNIRSDEYVGPHFTAKRSASSELEDIIERYLLFERIFRVDSLRYGSINGTDDIDIGPDDGVEINGDTYYPVIEEGFTEWQQLDDFMHALFTDDLAESYLLNGHYTEHDGNTFSLMAGGMGWYASSDYKYGTKELDGGSLRLDFYRIWDGGESGEYLVNKLILEPTADGYRISEVSEDFVSDYDSYDWLAPVDRFVTKTFYFNPDFSGRHDAEDAGESIVGRIKREIDVTLRYSSDGEFIGAATDGRVESIETICALDENRLLVYDWDMIAREQIYLLNFETGATEPVLPDTAFGFSFNDYYDITGKWETIVWVEGPRISPDGRRILYCSNKYFDKRSPAYSYGLWIYDIPSGTERRIPLPDGTDESITSYYEWTADGKIVFGYKDENYTFDPDAGPYGEYVTAPGFSGIPEFDPEATEEALSLGLWDDYIEASALLHLDRRAEGLVEFDGGEYIPLSEEYDTMEKCEALLQKVFTRDFCESIISNQFGRYRLFTEHDGKMYSLNRAFSGIYLCNFPIHGAVYNGENQMTVYTDIWYDGGPENADNYIFQLEKENGNWRIASVMIPDDFDGSVYYEFTQSYYYPDTSVAPDAEATDRLIGEYISEDPDSQHGSYEAEYTPITADSGVIAATFSDGTYVRIQTAYIDGVWQTTGRSVYLIYNEYLNEVNGGDPDEVG